ncbi:MAG: sugar porter family MFS transporter [Chthoniobacterales bacterium]|nr:sugar porter family MFS transporter [Chthoniobacterales bacterium]
MTQSNASRPAGEQNLAQVLLISCVAAIGGFLFGFDSGVINGTVDALQAAFQSSSVGSGFNVASMLLGCAAGALVAGPVADKLGRRIVMLITAILFGVSAWGSGISQSSAEFVVYRLLGGFAVGAASILCPAYISEVAPAALRGRLASLQQLAIVLGLFVSFLSNYLIAHAAGGAAGEFWFGFEAWQWMFWAEAVPSLIFLGSLMFIPESPRYLVAAGKLTAAREVLVRLGTTADPDLMVEEIKKTLRAGHKPRVSDVYDKAARRIHPIVWVGMGLAAFQQLVGINVVFYYGAVLWQAAGFSEARALMINVISGAVNIGSTLVAIALVDRLGRKPLLVFGSAGMAVMLGILAWIFASAGLDAAGRLQLPAREGTVALIAANAYIFCFGVSWGPVMWVMLGEMFSNQFRGAALSLSGFVQWMSNFAITITFPMLLAGFGLGGAYGLYTFFALLSGVFVVFLIRETKGKSLEEM